LHRPEGGIGCEQVAFERVPCAAMEMAENILEQTPSRLEIARMASTVKDAGCKSIRCKKFIIRLEQQTVEAEAEAESFLHCTRHHYAVDSAIVRLRG